MITWYEAANKFFEDDANCTLSSGPARNILLLSGDLDYRRTKILTLIDSLQSSMSTYRARIFKGESPSCSVNAEGFSELLLAIQQYKDSIWFFGILIQSTYGVDVKNRVLETVNFGDMW
jgi:hypothetical protein